MLQLREVRKKKNLTLKELGAIIGVGESTLSQYEDGKRQPDFETLDKIADFFNVSVDYLLGRVDHNVSSVLINGDMTRVPVLGRIAAGVPINAVEDILEYIEIPSSYLAGEKSFFALEIKGDSMSPNYLSGDIVVFERCDTCETGDDCAVMINGDDATFKRIERKENGIVVKPLNPQYETLFFTNKQITELPVRVIGIARELRRRK